MGLDMYLYVSVPYDAKARPRDEFVSPELYAEICEEIGLSEIAQRPAFFRDDWMDVCVGYWRKANAVHAWFVDECQGGVDECQLSESIHVEKLAELGHLCRRAVDAQDSDLLQPRSGFFFGSTDIDEYYWEDLAYTAELIERVIRGAIEGRRGRPFEFRYQSSW